jgi:predicted ATPase
VLRTFAVAGYRSLRSLVLGLGDLTVVTGPNGSGKSSLYRALRLLAETSRNGAVAALAGEGGLSSTVWAGPETTGQAVRERRSPVQGTRRKHPVAVKLGFAADDLGYALDLGLPAPSCETAFSLDPEIKREVLWHGPVLRPSTVMDDRGNGLVRVRDADGAWFSEPYPIRPFDSMLGEFADPDHTPELLGLRDRMRAWRFYDHFRTDPTAPVRAPSVGTRTPVLSSDGADLASALQTIREIGDAAALDTAVEHAFPGSTVAVASEAGRFEVQFHQPGLLRPLTAAELSEGTLRYQLFTAALLTPRPPELLVLNEPETSLHPDLLAALAGLITTAAARTQILTVTHSRHLITALDEAAGSQGPELVTGDLRTDLGATVIEGQGRLDEPSWRWPTR